MSSEPVVRREQGSPVTERRRRSAAGNDNYWENSVDDRLDRLTTATQSNTENIAVLTTISQAITEDVKDLRGTPGRIQPWLGMVIAAAIALLSVACGTLNLAVDLFFRLNGK